MTRTEVITLTVFNPETEMYEDIKRRKFVPSTSSIQRNPSK